jgi:hypothetical protein
VATTCRNGIRVRSVRPDPGDPRRGRRWHTATRADLRTMVAVWMPVTVVPTSSATVAIETFRTELSRVMSNCAAAGVARTVGPAVAAHEAVSVVIQLASGLGDVGAVGRA